MKSGDGDADKGNDNGHNEDDVDEGGGRGRGQVSREGLYKRPRHQLWGDSAHLSGPEEAA